MTEIIEPIENADEVKEPTEITDSPATSDERAENQEIEHIKLPSEDELDSLREEVTILREALAKKTAEADMIRGQLGEFSELFPDITPEDIPSEVWENIANTGSLAAAYSLYHRRAELQRERVHTLNKKNAALSTGKVGVDSAKEYFTPSEVRAMSRGEVHANYSKILNSMKKWN